MNKQRIFGIVTAVDGDDLLGHFVDHYFRLGLDELHVVVSEDSQMQRSAEMMARDRRIVVHPRHRDAMGEEIKTHTERDVLSAVVSRNDWVMHLDLDEFHQYPCDLRRLVAAMDEANIPLVSGDLVDRIAEDGGLHPVRPIKSIFAQFPVGCGITRSWLSLPCAKVMVCRGWVKLYYGRHHAENAGSFSPAIGTAPQYRVHHFKWFAGITERLLSRSDTWEKMDPWYKQTNRQFAESIRDNRIDPASVPDYEWCGEYQYSDSKEA
jgi:hypothetical protein